MNKMERPMMTVVRFGAEDVIATSSLVKYNTQYSALGSEIQQFGNVTGANIENADSLYSITYNGSDVNVGGESDAYNYAWYNETSGNWLTDNRTADYYQGNFPQK